MSHRGLQSVQKLNASIKNYGWELDGEYNGSHCSATFRCMKCGGLTTIARAKSIRTTHCKNCVKHICLNCGKQFAILNAQGKKTTRKFCFECLPESTLKQKGRTAYNALYRNYVKRMVIDRYGNKCTACGYDKCFYALDFHHLDPSEKEYAPSCIMISNKHIEEIFKELDKCILLCSNCHRELHNESKGAINDY